MLGSHKRAVMCFYCDVTYKMQGVDVPLERNLCKKLKKAKWLHVHARSAKGTLSPGVLLAVLLAYKHSYRS